MNNSDNTKTTTVQINQLDFKVLKYIQAVKGSSPRWQVRKALVDAGILPEDWQTYDNDLEHWFEWRTKQMELNGFGKK